MKINSSAVGVNGLLERGFELRADLANLREEHNSVEESLHCAET